VAAEAGVNFQHVNGASPQKYLVETMGAGVAVLDYDRDGWPDILFVNGRPLDAQARSEVGSRKSRHASPTNPPHRLSRVPDQPTNPSPRRKTQGARPKAQDLGPKTQGSTPHLFHNNRDGTFTDVTAGSGLEETIYGMGCAVGDFDNDGWPDIYVSAVLGPGRLFHNRGGKFEDVTRQAGLERGAQWGSGCAWLDYDRDGWLDLYVASYVRYGSLKQDIPCYVRPGRRSYCVPVAYEGASGVLYRNLGGAGGARRFADVTQAVGLQDATQKALGMIATDVDDDGWPDLVIANDTVPNRLFVNHGGRFSESAGIAGVAFGPAGQARGGMGVDAADWRNDGSQAIAITNFAHESIGFYAPSAPGPLLFTEQSAGLGTGRASEPFVGFGICFFDVENDGFLDLCAVNGHVRDDVAELDPGQSYAQPALLFRNQGGTRFEDVSSVAGPPVTTPGVRRGLAAADLDNDGRVDLVVTRNGGRAELWRNETAPAGHWLAIRLEGRRSNRDGIGARVSLRAGGQRQTAWGRGGGSYFSDSDHRLHFGLGTASRVNEISVRWPSGTVERFPACKGDQTLTLVEGGAR
jgi:hypothetical protein